MGELSKIKNQQAMANSKAPTISIDEVKKLVKEGYSRYTKDDKGYGSIQGKYNLTKAATKRLFSNPELKGIKTKYPDFFLKKDEKEGIKTDAEIAASVRTMRTDEQVVFA
jgi:hypothetical protein